MYNEGPVSFPVTYNLYTSAYGTSDYWSGFAISNRTATTFEAATLTPDQYNNITGKAHNGKNFCDATDWFKCTLTGEKADGTTVTKDIDLAKDGGYVNDWQLLDLSDMGAITSLSFGFSGSRSNDYGVLTPAYICIDDVTVEFE